MQTISQKEFVMPNRMDSILSKGAGMMKGVKARLDGLHGVFRTLAEQHGEVSAMLKRLQDKPEKRAELWPEIRRELMSHERAEMREIYPVLRQHPQTRALAEHHDQEAAELERLIERIDAQTVDWRTLYDELVDAVVHHANEDENEIFPKAQEAIGERAAVPRVQGAHRGERLATRARDAGAHAGRAAPCLSSWHPQCNRSGHEGHH
jgi:hemerythrin-like domain-containing protein